MKNWKISLLLLLIVGLLKIAFKSDDQKNKKADEAKRPRSVIVDQPSQSDKDTRKRLTQRHSEGQEESEYGYYDPLRVRRELKFSEPGHGILIRENLTNFQILARGEKKSIADIDELQQQMAVIISLPIRLRYEHSYFQDDGWIYVWGGKNPLPLHGYAVEMKTGEFYTWHTYEDKQDFRHLQSAPDYFFKLEDLKNRENIQ